MARVRWSQSRLPKYVHSMWSNTEDWEYIRKAPELITFFGGMGQQWVSELNNELHAAQAARRQKVEDGYKFAISMDSDRIRMRIWAFTARAAAHEAKHQSILKLMKASGWDVRGGTGGRRNPGSGRSRSTGGGSRGNRRTRPSGGGGSGPRSRPSMDPKREAKLRRKLAAMEALSKDMSTSESERGLAAEHARRVRRELGE